MIKHKRGGIGTQVKFGELDRLALFSPEKCAGQDKQANEESQRNRNGQGEGCLPLAA
jgi:hypothetical protein